MTSTLYPTRQCCKQWHCYPISSTRMERCINKPKPQQCSLLFGLFHLCREDSKLCTLIAETVFHLPSPFQYMKPSSSPSPRPFRSCSYPRSARSKMEAYPFCFYRLIHWSCCGAFDQETPVRRTFDCVECPVTWQANGTLCQPRRINVTRVGKCLRCSIREARRARGECEEDHGNLEREP